MADKKKIAVELIEAATKDELLDIAGRLGIEDKVHLKMLKAEIQEVVLTEFLAQQEQTEDADPADTAVESTDEIVARLRNHRKAAPEPAPEPETEPEPETPARLSYHIVKGGKETTLGFIELRAIRRQLGIKTRELVELEAVARRDGQASVLKVRRVKGRTAKIAFVVRTR